MSRGHGQQTDRDCKLPELLSLDLGPDAYDDQDSSQRCEYCARQRQEQLSSAFPQSATCESANTGGGNSQGGKDHPDLKIAEAAGEHDDNSQDSARPN